MAKDYTNTETITRNLRVGKYKYTYTYNGIKEKEILKMVNNNCTEVRNDCLQIIDDGF